MARPLTHADLIFPIQSLSISSTLHSLKRSALSTHNRLSSIQSDAAFVDSVSEAFGLPLVANERCGSWYIPPEKKTESVYFKSTDGHMNEWSFSLRRLNLRALELIGKSGGCVIVDSTRRGKSMPDALSKTIPIWCCVLNRALFPELGQHDLHTPPQAVSESEHAQIEKHIDGFVRGFLDICKPDIDVLRAKLKKPLRPIWITQKSSLPDILPSFPDFHPVVLCTASRRVNGAEGSEGGYIQGAADDHEAWAQGLTPTLFWGNKDQLLTTNEEDLPALIAKLVKEEQGPDAIPILIKPTSNLYISSAQNIDISPFDIIISCTPSPLLSLTPTLLKTKKHLHLQCQTGKLGSRDLRTQLPHLPPFFATLPSPPGKILLCDPTGKDLAVGLALTILSLYTAPNGTITPGPAHPTTLNLTKPFIKQRLTWLTTTHPMLNPPRGTLQSVNAFLMPDPLASAPSTPAYINNTTMLPPPSTPDPAIHQHPAPNAATIFHALQNKGKPWTFTRTLSSSLPTQPSGTVTGKATLTPYPSLSTSTSTSSTPSPSPPSPSTLPSPAPASPPPLLYAETGTFHPTTTTCTPQNQNQNQPLASFAIHKSYIYHLKPAASSSSSSTSHTSSPSAESPSPTIAIHFHPTNALFTELGTLSHTTLEPSDEAAAAGAETVLVAKNKARHLCGEDVYAASWKFGRGMGMVCAAENDDKDGDGKEAGEERESGSGRRAYWWEVRYDVKGPRKAYVSETRYTSTAS